MFNSKALPYLREGFFNSIEMKVEALRNFFSIDLQKNFKKGSVITEDPKLMGEWVRNGICKDLSVKEKESKTKVRTKELKTPKQTKK